MDNFVPQTGGLEVKEGHEESDLSIRGIISFGVVLAVSGLLTFVLVAVFMSDRPVIGLAWWEKKIYPVQLSPAEERLQAQRKGLEPVAKPQEGEAERAPESYPPGGDRRQTEEHLSLTFPTPRLQYDDTHDMNVFRGSEDKWLESTGRTANGNIHISIDRAKDLLVKSGLRPVSGPFVPPTLPSAAPLVPAPAAPRGR